MVQVNKDERVCRVCFKMARVQNAHAVQRLWPNCWPCTRVSTIHAILNNYRKYRQHGTSLNRNKVNNGSLVFSYIVIKGKIKIKSSGFSRPLHSSSATHSSVNFCPTLKN